MTDPLHVLVGHGLSKISQHCRSTQSQLDSMQAEMRRLEDILSEATDGGFSPKPPARLPHTLLDEDSQEPLANGSGHCAEPATPPPASLRNAAFVENGASKPLHPQMSTVSMKVTERTCKEQTRHRVESLAAARLGMLTHEQVIDEKLAPINNIFDAFNAFTVSTDDGPFAETTAGEDNIIASTFGMFARSTFFRACCVLGIAANTLFIGFYANFMVRNSYRRLEGEPEWSSAGYTAAEIGFVVWFSFELLVRICSDQKRFLASKERKWNIFDVVLVGNSIVEVVFPELLANMSFLRIFRVFRLVRVVRIVRTVPALKSLRTMVFAMLNSFICLLWAFVLIALIIFVFSVVFSTGVAEHFHRLSATDAEDMALALDLNEHFGSLYRIQVTLFASITGGNDWMVYGTLIRHLQNGELYFICFGFYVAFCLIGMLNVVTGIFVDSAVCTRTEDEVVDNYLEELQSTSEAVRRIFKGADVDKSDTLDRAELQRHLHDPWVKAYFAGLEIDPSEAEIIFTLMDKENKQVISIDEFVDGAMKLKGHAKAIDILSLMFDHVHMQNKLGMLCVWMEDQIWALKESLNPSTSRPMSSEDFVFEKPVIHGARACRALTRGSMSFFNG
eukprot:TRINITY_DN9756_c0_g1_i2.p1 TRINITY_DN9756_c0_g1~~TRINITY_DN9756_c0_g1_i2.p1  ORF type:complete len:618 (+),score=95.05 TRINITY_DN9756_c0_g1_i2:109-1962(+)